MNFLSLYSPVAGTQEEPWLVAWVLPTMSELGGLSPLIICTRGLRQQNGSKGYFASGKGRHNYHDSLLKPLIAQEVQ